MRQTTRGTAIDVLPVQGGWSVLLRLPAPPGEREWPLVLLQDAGILTQPGWYFDLPGDGWLVLSLLPPPDWFRTGVRLLVQTVERA